MNKSARVLVGVCGSIAAVKATEVVRRLRDAGYDVHCVMTQAATRFVSPLALAVFSSKPVLSEMFGQDAYTMPHLTLSSEADVMLIVAASASTLSRCANGLADDMVSLCYLTTQASVIMAPAMHNTMWEHPATQANVQTLKSRGVKFVGPYEGPLADHTRGEGRLTDPKDIVAAVEKVLEAKKK